MATRPRSAPSPLIPPGLDPLRFTWDVLTNAKFALVMVATAALAGFIGVVLPQVPAAVRGSPAARSAWLEEQRQDFGAFTTLMDRFDLFDVFYSPWFNGLWVVIIVAVTVCTISRFRPVWRSVERPPREVPDRYFETAHRRANFAHRGGAAPLERALRARRFRVEQVKQAGDATCLFAERFAWAQFATFFSHLALLMLLIGALLTRFAGFDVTLVVAEAAPGAPVFEEPGPGQIFVRVTDAFRGVDDDGNIIDFHSDLEVRQGAETLTCTTTVNDPCHAFGYKIHQAAYFDDFARLRITAADGRLVFDDLLDFESRATRVPLLRVTDTAGRILFEQPLPQMATDPGASPGREDDLALADLAFPSAPGTAITERLLVAWRVEEGRTIVRLTGGGLEERRLAPGESVEAGGFRVTYVGERAIPAIRLLDLPGAEGEALVQMPVDRVGQPYLFVNGVGNENLFLVQGRPTTAGPYTYTFEGRVEASGVDVRRDPGDTFIWVAVGMADLGLTVTFWVPRRRLWARVTPSRVYFAGVAEKTVRLEREFGDLARALGSPEAPPRRTDDD